MRPAPAPVSSLTLAAPTRTRFARAGLGAAVAVLSLGLVACGSDSAPVDAGPAQGGAPVLEERTEERTEGADGVDAISGIDEAMGGELSKIDAGEGDYTFGLGRDSIAEAVQSTFSSENARAAWEGDTLVLTMDGDATEVRAGYLECSVVGGLVNEADSVAVVFPNGRVDCSEFDTP